MEGHTYVLVQHTTKSLYIHIRKALDRVSLVNLFTGISKKTRETTSILADFIRAARSNTSKTTCFCPGSLAAATLCRGGRVNSEAQNEQAHDQHRSGSARELPVALHFLRLLLPALVNYLVRFLGFVLRGAS